MQGCEGRRECMAGTEKVEPTGLSMARFTIWLFHFFFFKPGDMEVCHLVQQISELIEFLPQLKPTFNLETEIGLAIQPLRSECSQLRRYDLFHFHCHVHFSTTQLTILTQSRTGNWKFYFLCTFLSDCAWMCTLFTNVKKKFKLYVNHVKIQMLFLHYCLVRIEVQGERDSEKRGSWFLWFSFNTLQWLFKGDHSFNTRACLYTWSKCFGKIKP